jgi:hypothetical protein
MPLAVNTREAARSWIAATIEKHLRPEFGGTDRIQLVAADIESTAYQHNVPVELVVELAAEWCDEQIAQRR